MLSHDPTVAHRLCPKLLCREGTTYESLVAL
jgi:hypothetical protein